MAVTVRNIIVGAANLYVGAADATVPAFVSGTAFNTTLAADSDWRHVGATQEGVEVGYEPDIGEVEVDQLKGPALLFNTAVSVTMNTNLAEATLENLILAWGLDESALTVDGTTDVDTLGIGVAPDDMPERKLIVVGKAPKLAGAAPRERIYVARRVISVDASSHALRRTEATIFPVSFRLLPDPAEVGSEYGEVMDRLVTTVP